MKMISYFVHVLFCIVTIIVTSNGKRLTYASAKVNANFSDIIVNNVSSVHVQLGQGHIQCLQSCLDNIHCMSFFYNFLSRECRHYEVDFTDPEDGIPENGWKYYTVIRDCRINGLACPTSTGYTFAADICLCYRYESMRFNKTMAEQNCAAEKGSLVKIDRRLKQLEMERRLSAENSWNANYIQGARVENTTVWRFNDGQDMHYFNWNNPNPKLRDSIMINNNNNYLWHDTRNSTGAFSICEIVL